MGNRVKAFCAVLAAVQERTHDQVRCDQQKGAVRNISKSAVSRISESYMIRNQVKKPQ